MRVLSMVLAVFLSVLVLAGCQSTSKRGHHRRRNATNGIACGTGRGTADFSPERRKTSRQHKVTNPIPGLEQPTKLGEFSRKDLLEALQGTTDSAADTSAASTTSAKSGVTILSGKSSKQNATGSEIRYREAPPPSR